MDVDCRGLLLGGLELVRGGGGGVDGELRDGELGGGIE